MPHLKKYLLAFGALIALVVFARFNIYSEKESERPVVTKSSPYFYQDPARDISKVRLKVFYVVPANKPVYMGWPSLLPDVLSDAVRFHMVQFRGFSTLAYEIFSEPLVLERESVFYDTEDTNRGNPEGLKNIVPVVEARAADFLKAEEDEFTVIAIIYEGVGASGTDGAMILSRSFLSDEQYRSFRSSLFYHEFGHTFGLPDGYDLQHSTPHSNDIMGIGRGKPIDTTYIDRELLKDMGVIR